MTNFELSFTFQPLKKNQISKLIKLLNDKKAAQSTDIPTKLIKEFCDFFSEFIYKSINHYITERNFIVEFKKAEVRPLYKNDGKADKSKHRPIRHMKVIFIVNYTITLIKIFFRNTDMAFVKPLILSMPF